MVLNVFAVLNHLLVKLIWLGHRTMVHLGKLDCIGWLTLLRQSLDLV